MPPIGYKRSRALWDETRRSDSTWRDTLRAISYELQPFRFSKANRDKTTTFLKRTIKAIIALFRSLPGMLLVFLKFLRERPLSQWMTTGGVVGYYYFVRWMHNILDAGPFVIIVTSLVLIFTIGLGDDSNRDGLSAYSVFNRGFEKLLGAVDQDALLAQHVGGGLGGGEGMRNGAGGNDDREEERMRPRERRRLLREAMVGGNEENDDTNRENQNNVARKSGKKARRRNLEQRREIRRQREAAEELGDVAFD